MRTQSDVSRFPRVEIPRRLVERSEQDVRLAVLGRRERVSQWRELFYDVRRLVGMTCPFPVHVYREHDYCRTTVRAGGVLLARLDDDELAAVSSPAAVVAWIVITARAGYAALERPPIPTHITLGDN